MGKATILVDLDGTLCDTDGKNYSLAEPDETMVTFVNLLKEMGNKITVYTARGSSSGINYVNMIKRQMDMWGAKYDDIKQKPSADLIIDDMSVTPEEIHLLVDKIWR